MAYTQKDIQKKPNDDETGRSSLLISFANLLDRFGVIVSPSELDTFFTDNDIHDINFNSISKFDNRLSVSSFGSNGQPLKSDAIMRFEYLSNETGKIFTHYCVVENNQESTIVDSYSGIIKHFGVYGGTGSWAAYIFKQPVTVPSDIIHIEDSTPEEVTIVSTNVVIEPETHPETTDITPEEKIQPIQVNKSKLHWAWQNTYRPGLSTIETVSIKSITIKDLAGELPDKELPANVIVPVVGKFKKDGEVYYRTSRSVQDNSWYGIPKGVLILKSKYKSDNDDSDINEIYDETTKDKVIRAAAKLEGKTKKLFSFGRNN